MILVDLGFDDLDVGESLSQLFCKVGADGVFCLEVTGINESDAIFCGIGKLIVLAIRSDQSIIAQISDAVEGITTATAPHGHLGNGLLAGDVAQSLTAQDGLDMGNKALRLCGRDQTATEKAVVSALFVPSYGIDDLYLSKADTGGKAVIDSAGGAV